MRSLRLRVAWGLLFLLTASFLWAQPVEKENRIVYSNIAAGELQKGEDWLQNFNARIEFRSSSKAPYAGVYVRIFNESGVTVFAHLCEKPWLFVKLPEGEYHVIGVDRKKNQQMARFKVKEPKLTHVQLVWSAKVVGY